MEVTPAGTGNDLGSFDAFVIASAENNPLFADVYGLRFQPLVAERLTTMKRISALGADDEHVVVAAADGDVDRLALVAGDGSLSELPGLGRPYAFSPEVADGVVYYEVLTSNSDTYRFLSFDLNRKAKTKLFESSRLSGILPVGNGVTIHGQAGKPPKNPDLVVVRQPSGQVKSIPVSAEGFGLEAGRRWLATTIQAAGSSFGDNPASVELIDRISGRLKRVKGFQAVCWTPDGTKLLARRVGDPLSSPLVLLDPTKPDDVIELGTVPGLAIYNGAWVRGEPPA